MCICSPQNQYQHYLGPCRVKGGFEQSLKVKEFILNALKSVFKMLKGKAMLVNKVSEMQERDSPSILMHIWPKSDEK